MRSLLVTRNREHRAHSCAIGRVLCRVVWLAVSISLLLPPQLAYAQVAGELRGRVIDANTSQPVPGSRIEVSGRADATMATSSGAFVVRGLESRTYTVTVRAVGYVATVRDVSVTNARTTTLEVALVPRVVVLGDVSVVASRDTIASSAVVFNRAAIEQSGGRDIGDLLQTTPGVVITRAGGVGQNSQISIRGSGSDQVLVLVDGMPLNSAVSGGADLSRVALESVSRVTVLTGAQSARYGPRAMAGVIDIKTRRPRHEVSTQLRLGSFGERNASISVGESLQYHETRFGGSLNADRRSATGDFRYSLPALRGGGRATRNNADADATQVDGAIRIDGTFGGGALRANWQEMERGMAGSMVQPSSTGRQNGRRLSTSANADGQRGILSWNAVASFTKEQNVSRDLTPPFGLAFDDSTQVSAFSAQIGSTIAGSVGNVSFGTESRTLNVESTALNPGAPGRQQLLGAWFNANTRRSLSDKWELGIDFSTRADHNSRYSNATLSPRGSLRLARNSIGGSLTVGSGYAPPTLADQFFHEGVQVRANPNLRPERTRRDVEARLNFRDLHVPMFQISGDVAAYRSNVEGMILWMPNFQYIWSPINFDVNRSGIELSGTARSSRARIELQGVFNRNDVTYTGGVITGQVAYRPRITGNFSIVYTPGATRIELRNRYVGTRRVSVGTPLNALLPYWMSDVALSATRELHGWTFSPIAGIENLMNRSAAMLVDYPFPPRTWTLSVRVRRSASQPS